jgi:hypothetical protein
LSSHGARYRPKPPGTEGYNPAPVPQEAHCLRSLPPVGAAQSPRSRRFLTRPGRIPSGIYQLLTGIEVGFFQWNRDLDRGFRDRYEYFSGNGGFLCPHYQFLRPRAGTGTGFDNCFQSFEFPINARIYPQKTLHQNPVLTRL